jgi:hypothetical protein
MRRLLTDWRTPPQTDEVLSNRLAPVPRRVLWVTLVAGALLSLAVTRLVATRAIFLGVPDAGWAYGYHSPFQPESLTTFAFVGGLCAAVILLVPFTVTRRYERAAILLWLVVGTYAQLQLRSLTPYSLRTLFAAEGANGMFQAAHQYPAATLLRDFDRLRPTLSSMHARANMPGKTILVHGLLPVAPRPAALARIVIVLTNLGGVLLYLFVRDWFGDRDTALIALVFYLFVPAKLLFFPVFNTLTPTFVFACVWLWLRVLQRHEVKTAAALGLACYWLAFFEPTPAVIGVLAASLAAQTIWRAGITPRRALALAAVTVVTFLAAHAAMTAVFGFNLFSALQTIARDAAGFNQLSVPPRPYGVWVVRNLVDFFFGVGLCQTLLFGWSLVIAAWPGHERLAAVAFGVAGALLAVDLLGINRGEVIRLWIFLACFVQIPAAYACARLESRLAVLLVVATSLLQVAVGTSMVAFTQP